MGLLKTWLSRRRTDAPDLVQLTSHLAIDVEARSLDPESPAFMTPPAGAPPFHGFKVLEDVEAGGFRWGAITDFTRQPALATGDAFVVAPDGGRCGLEWRMSDSVYLLEMAPFTHARWGVWLAGIRHPMVDLDAARRNLEELRPLLEEKWRNWHAYRALGGQDTLPNRPNGQ
ncbi:MAG: hypothetical protein OEO77_06780 [Acidimicrobiia bacterium]|nr:hypothetical protein [Acidimicrobiia bacterium]